jgi:hypothetical protein
MDSIDRIKNKYSDVLISANQFIKNDNSPRGITYNI